MVSVDEARRELARRELARRRAARGEGTSDVALPAPQTPNLPPPSARNDPSILPAIAQGATVGFSDEMAGLARGGARALQSPSGGSLIGAAVGGARPGQQIQPDNFGAAYEDERDISRQRLADTREAMPIASTVAEVGGSLVPGIGLAGAGLSLAGRAAASGGGLGRVALGSIADGGALGAVYGAGASDGDRLAGGKEGASYGAAFGLAAPYLTAGASSLARRAVSPVSSTPERQALVNVLLGEGVQPTAGQATGSSRLRYMESELGGGRAANMLDTQGEQFTAAALRRVGVDANRATPEVIDSAFDRIGAQFDDVAARNSIPADRQLATDIQGLVGEYQQLVPEGARVPAIQNLADDIAARMQSGGLSGESYQAYRSRLNRMARSSSDPEVSSTLRGMQTALDDAMERNIANPNDMTAWREARSQYRNMLVIEQAATGAGESTAAGLISPSQLRNATVSKQGRRNYARGQGDFSELARAGEAVLKPLPNSGTAGRLGAQALGSIPALLGAGAGGAAGDGLGAMAGLLIGGAVPRMAGAAMMSGAGQRYLGNQVLAGPTSERTRAIINALLNTSGASTNARLSGP